MIRDGVQSLVLCVINAGFIFRLSKLLRLTVLTGRTVGFCTVWHALRQRPVKLSILVSVNGAQRLQLPDLVGHVMMLQGRLNVLDWQGRVVRQNDGLQLFGPLELLYLRRHHASKLVVELGQERRLLLLERRSLTLQNADRAVYTI